MNISDKWLLSSTHKENTQINKKKKTQQKHGSKLKETLYKRGYDQLAFKKSADHQTIVISEMQINTATRYYPLDWL